uniref:Uncharacterized protein n=1 Tax=Lepeophtheirus salmonis TaxID=72036 RepID=A0A0K2VG10_LEPSM
MKILKSGATAR